MASSRGQPPGSSSGVSGGFHGPSGSHNNGGEELLTPENAARICQDVQHMIDINSEHLERLRTPMTSTSGKNLKIFVNFK